MSEKFLMMSIDEPVNLAVNAYTECRKEVLISDQIKGQNCFYFIVLFNN